MNSKPVTLPNVLTALRIAAAPLLALAVSIEHEGLPHWTAALILLFAALTDFADGQLARSIDQVSKLGMILDPIADKILTGTALFLLCAEGRLEGVNLWPALVILWRELLISGLREHDKRFPCMASRAAKWKTALQFAAAILLFASRPASPASAILFRVGIFLLWGAAALTLYTGMAYIWQARRSSWK